jgi:putative ABC transport system ATP-binding protein
LALATPLAVESLVNVVSWGTYLQPLIILGLMLMTCLGLAGVLRVLQTVVVEMIQRRQFVRIVGDLAHRFPRANQASLVGEYPRALANRVFDIMTIQKATAILLLDGVSIVLTTTLGLVLLAFYHPFLLGFDIALVISMISITWVLGRGGIRTAIEESITKYEVAHWLQDVLASPSVFKTGGGEALAIARANQLTADYIIARQRQFRVVIRQVVFAVGLQVIASTALLALGGWLVIAGQLTLGQLVASELVVTVVVGAFAKAGKSLEKFYDLMAGIEKVGHLLDITVDPRREPVRLPDEAVEVGWSDLVFQGAAYQSKIPAVKIPAGARVGIVGDDIDGCSELAKTLAGLAEPTHGLVQIGGFDALQAATNSAGRLIGYAGGEEIFHGTLRENIDLGRLGIGQHRIREVLQQVGLASSVLHLPDGLETELQTGGYPLTDLQVTQLLLARAIVANPRLLIVDRLLDKLDPDSRAHVWNTLSSDAAPWTLVVVTSRDDLAARCESQIAIRRT